MVNLTICLFLIISLSKQTFLRIKYGFISNKAVLVAISYMLVYLDLKCLIRAELLLLMLGLYSINTYNRLIFDCLVTWRSHHDFYNNKTRHPFRKSLWNKPCFHFSLFPMCKLFKRVDSLLHALNLLGPSICFFFEFYLNGERFRVHLNPALNLCYNTLEYYN